MHFRYQRLNSSIYGWNTIDLGLLLVFYLLQKKMLLPPEIHNSKMMKIISLCAKKESPPTLSHLNFMPNFSVKFLSGLVEEGRFTDTVFICLFEYDGLC